MSVRKSPANNGSKAKLMSKHRASKVSGNSRMNYKCARCDTFLFSQADLVEHHDIVSMSSSSLGTGANYLAGSIVVNSQAPGI